MASNILNYAHKYEQELIQLVEQESLISPLMQNPTNIRWTGAKTFHLTAMNTKGFKEHSRDGGWNRQTIRQTDVPFTISHDRDVEFLIDVADVDESNETASIANITNNFMQSQAIPEMDAYTFSHLATRAISQAKAEYISTQTIDKESVYEDFKKLISPLRRYSTSLVAYATSAWFDAMEQSPRFNKTIDVANLNGPASLETRIARVDGITIIEVFDEERFMTSYDYSDGFKASEEAKQINFLVVSNLYNFFVPKFQNIYSFAPGAHTQGDGYLYQNRSMWDVFTIKNYKDIEEPVIDSIAVNYTA